MRQAVRLPGAPPFAVNAAPGGGRGLLPKLLMVYVALLPVQVALAEDLRVAPSDFFLLLYLLLGAGTLRVVKSAWSVWHLGLLAAFALSIATAAIFKGQLSRYILLNKGAGIVFLFAGYLVITSAARDWSRIRALLRVLVVSVTLQNIFAVTAFASWYLYGISVPLLNEENFRLSGMLIDANGYGGMLVMTLAIVELSAASGHPIVGRRFRHIAAATLGMGIVLTFSRSTWISLSLIWAWSLFFQRRFARRVALGALSVGLLVLLVFGTGFLDYARPMAWRPAQVEERFSLVESALAQFASRPFFGIGIGSFLDYRDRIIHNTSLWFLTEFGMIGFTIFAALMCWFFLAGISAYRNAPPAGRAIVLALVASHLGMLGLSVGIEAFYKRDWWLAMALLGSARAVSLREVRVRLAPGWKPRPARPALPLGAWR